MKLMKVMKQNGKGNPKKPDLDNSGKKAKQGISIDFASPPFLSSSTRHHHIEQQKEKEEKNEPKTPEKTKV